MKSPHYYAAILLLSATSAVSFPALSQSIQPISTAIYTEVQQQKIEMRYLNLYHKLKYNTQYSDVKLGMYLVDQQTGMPCFIHKRELKNKNNKEEWIYPIKTNELTIPIDRHLKKVNPDVTFFLSTSAICDVSMEIQSTHKFGTKITHHDINNLTSQMQSLFSDLSGSLSIFWRPEIAGITVHLQDKSFNQHILVGDKVLNSKNGMFFLPKESLKDNQSVNFPSVINKVTAWVQP